MSELFIYYRVLPGASPAALEAAASLQRGLCAAHPGLEARLLRRTDSTTGAETFMETYAASRGAATTIVDAALEAEIENRSDPLRPFIDGPRHCERFETLPSSR